MGRMGRFRVEACGAVVLAAAVALAQAPEAEDQPRIQFDKLEHDFGRANSGEDLKTTFGFKNAGDGTLVIQRVKGG